MMKRSRHAENTPLRHSSGFTLWVRASSDMNVNAVRGMVSNVLAPPPRPPLLVEMGDGGRASPLAPLARIRAEDTEPPSASDKSTRSGKYLSSKGVAGKKPTNTLRAPRLCTILITRTAAQRHNDADTTSNKTVSPLQLAWAPTSAQSVLGGIGAMAAPS